MKKRIISTAMAICLILTLLPPMVTTPAKAATKTVTDLTSGQTLISGIIYRVSSSLTINGGGLTVAGGATAVIYIAPGATLTVNGGAGSGQSGGRPGIYVPVGATLIITGSGTLAANGGSGARGGDGGWMDEDHGGTGGYGGGGGKQKKKLKSDHAGGGGQGGSGYDSGGKGMDGDNSTVTYVGGSGGGCGYMGGGGYSTIQSDPALLSTLTLNTHLTYPGNSTNTNKDGKTSAGTTSVSLYFGASALSKITVPTRTGYSFKGYFIDQNCTSTQIYNADGTSALTSNDSTYVDTVGKWVYANDTTLYAKWEANTYSVTLNANGGSNGTTTSFQYDVVINPQTSYKPKRVGYIFNGYYTATSGGTQVFDDSMTYTAGAGTSNLQSQFYQNTTLYAHWTPVHYTIHYYSWDPDKQTAVFVKEQKNVTYGTMTFPDDSTLGITKAHCTFGGWNSYPDQDWVMYNANHTYTGGLTETNDAIVPLYAVWVPVGQITISYKPEGGKNVPADGTAYQGENYTIPSQEPTKDNSTFLGWNTASDGTGSWFKYNAGGGTTTLLNGQTAAAKMTAGTTNVTLYAVWKDSPTLTYNANGGTGYIPLEYHAKGSNVTLITASSTNAPVREGYTLKGWATTANATTALTSFTMPDANTTLYAVWAVKQLTVTAPKANIDFSGTGKVSVVGWDTAKNQETTLVSSVDYDKSYTFAVKVENHYDVSTMTAAINSSPIMRSDKVAGTGANAAYTYYIYQVNNPHVNQSISVRNLNVKTYLVSLICNGGTSDPLTAYTYGSAVTLPIPTKTGYTFNGWYITKDFTGGPVTEISATDDGNKTFYAKWTEKTYTVTFNANGGTLTGTAPTQTLTYNKTEQLTALSALGITAPSTAVSGNEFLGWATKADATTASYADEQYVTNLTSENAITLYAVWNVPTYTVSYDLNGGSGSLAQVSAKAGTDVTLDFTTPTRTGYTLAGWDSNGDGTAEYTSPDAKSITAISSNVSLKAVWTANTYTVKFEGGTGAEGTMDDETFTYDDALKALTKNTFTNSTASKTVFQGWTTSTGVKLYDEQLVRNLCSDSGGTVTLTAVWGNAAVNYVSYDPNGGVWPNGEYLSATPATDGSAELTVTGDGLPTREGYTFAGWADDADATTATYTSTSATKSGVTANTKVYAVWAAGSYTVTFHDNNGSETEKTSTQDFTYGTAQNLTANTFAVPAGYVFSGWATAADGAVIYTDGQSVSNLAASGNVDLYAVWGLKDPVTLIFDVVGGNVAQPVTVSSETSIDLSDKESYPNPTRTGYKFLGWSETYVAPLAEDGKTDAISLITAPITMTANKTVYAVWQAVSAHNIIYTTDGTTAYPLDGQSYYPGTTVTVIFTPAPTKTGYTFAGWSDGTTTYTSGGTKSFMPT